MKSIGEMSDEEIRKYFDTDEMYKGMTDDKKLRLKELINNPLFPKIIKFRFKKCEAN